MSMNIRRSRKSFTKAHKNLRRARHLFALFVRRTVEADRTGIAMKRAIVHAQRAGLYCATSCEKDILYSIARKFRMQHPEFNHYWEGWGDYRRKYLFIWYHPRWKKSFELHNIRQTA